MNEKIKNYLGMSGIGAIIIIALSISFFVYSFSQYSRPYSYRSFQVTGEGKVTAIPDISTFNFSIISQGDKNIIAIRKENTDKNNKVIAFLKANKVADKDIKTQNYSVEPRYKYFNCPVSTYETKPCPPAEIVGYTITQTVDVKIRDFDTIGAILAGVVENGANVVSMLSFSIDDLESIKNKAREEAIAKAKVKALSIAKSAGFTLDRLISVSEDGPLTYQGVYPVTMSRDMKSEMPPPVVAPTIEPGSQEVVVNITLNYEID